MQENESGGGRWLVFGTEPQAPFFVVAWSADRACEPVHLAFAAPTSEAVDAFHAAGGSGAVLRGLPPRPRWIERGGGLSRRIGTGVDAVIAVAAFLNLTLGFGTLFLQAA